MLHDAITERVLSAAMKVHTALGAGCLESTYDACLRYQLTKDGTVACGLPSPTSSSKTDVIVELKAVEINCYPSHLREGIRRVMNGYGGR